MVVAVFGHPQAKSSIILACISKISCILLSLFYICCVCVCVCVCGCVRACVRACVCVCVNKIIVVPRHEFLNQPRVVMDATLAQFF